MCGIAGILSAGHADALHVYRMATALRHRGPDDEGYVALTGGGAGVVLAGPETAAGCVQDDAVRLPNGVAPVDADLVLGVRRLAILDLSPTGHQPMRSADGRLWMAHNGEIYNYRELHEELSGKGHVFRGGSDTEVALAAYREWGTRCFERFNGMWAMAIWDDVRRTLVLSRDRFGVKPLYTTAWNEGVAFASEIKALIAVGARVRPNEPALRRFLATGRIDVSDAETCFRDITQVEPGTYVEWPLRGPPRTSRYYELAPTALDGADAVAGLYELLDDAVALRLRSDVSVGSCLSGGLDSSSIVALAQARLLGSSERMQTFTFGAASEQLDETRYARAVAAATGAEAAFVGEPLDLIQELELVTRDQEEPVGSGSVLAQRQVMSLASRNGAKVLLDGQGGDEVLAGYGYYMPARLADIVTRLDAAGLLREARGAVSNGLGSGRWLARATLGELRRRRPGRDRLLDRQLDDVRGHLPALLHYEDRNSMAFSIETRLPFLDYRVAEFGLGLPGSAKIDHGWTKAALRRVVADRLPEEIVWRKDKIQFSVPQQRWLAGPLRELADDLLGSRTFAERSVSGGPQVRDLLARVDVLDGVESDRLWRSLALELWYRTYVDAAARVQPDLLAPARSLT